MGLSNKRMKLTIAIASPHGTRRGAACSPFGEHRALAAYPRCDADRNGNRDRDHGTQEWIRLERWTRWMMVVPTRVVEHPEVAQSRVGLAA